MSSSVPTTASRSFCANEDYRFYLEKLKQACDTHDRDLHAYVLMTNHVHLLITPNQGNSLSKATQMLGRYYIQYLNGSYQHTGTFWEGRYKATLIDSEAYALTCYRYAEGHQHDPGGPERAGVLTPLKEERYRGQ